MAPAKNKGRSAVPQSDYDTDYYAANEILTIPVPAKRTNEQLNFAVLQRHYPELTSIVHVASFCVVYTFSTKTHGWDKNGIEGTLFVCQLAPVNDISRFAAIVLNRRSMDTFFLELKTAEDVELTDDFIICQDRSTTTDYNIHGLWIFSEPAPSSTARARELTGEMIKSCASMAENSRRTLEAIERAENQSSEDELTSVAMGRQLSLRQLFGKQREMDAGFSIHHHEPSPIGPYSWTLPGIKLPDEFAERTPERAAAAAAVQKYVVTPQFTNTPDTEFFLSASKSKPSQGKPSQGKKPKNTPRRRKTPQTDASNGTVRAARPMVTGWGLSDIRARDTSIFNTAKVAANKVAGEKPKVGLEATWIPTENGVKKPRKAVTTKF
ncbi:Decapping enzyme [Neofusicoccum parvum]|uniref:Decapping enzyme n=1 Tax=Neofusicoccum parvum TaxID=310453 RepID=A0ACB5SFK5_9PEZI|nr:Decapping enzyme [Neofusicoccum parvum]